MYYLTFDSSDEQSKDNYSILYQGLIATFRPVTTPETRVINRILDKLEVLGKPEMEGNGAIIALSKSGTVEFEDVEYNLFNECLQMVKWSTKSSRKVERAVDWFGVAPTVVT
jgi:hypothetical protein